MRLTEFETHAADGTRLFYEVSGARAGAPGALLCDGIGCDGFVWKYLRPALDPSFRVVHGHYRGHGRSGNAPDFDRYTMADNVADMLHVADEGGFGSGLVFGHSMGVQLSLEVALTAPERVTGLVLMCGSFGRPLDTFHDHTLLKLALPLAKRIVRRISPALRPVLERLMPTDIGWFLAQLSEVDGRLLKREDFIPYLEHLSRMDPEIFLHMLGEAAKHSTESRLGEVDVPVLIIGGERDKFTPFWVSEVMADRLPRAELHMLRGGTHTAPLEQIELTWLLIQDWMERHDLQPPAVVAEAARC